MKKLFISQPMRDKTEEEILAVRSKVKRDVEKSLGEKVAVLNSFFRGVQGDPEAMRALWCLGESIKLMAKADVAYFAKGWEEARGCRIERECAEEYGITVIEYGGVI